MSELYHPRHLSPALWSIAGIVAIALHAGGIGSWWLVVMGCFRREFSAKSSGPSTGGPSDAPSAMHSIASLGVSLWRDSSSVDMDSVTVKCYGVVVCDGPRSLSLVRASSMAWRA